MSFEVACQKFYRVVRKRPGQVDNNIYTFDSSFYYGTVFYLSFLADNLCFHLERVGKKKRKRASITKGRAIGGLKKMIGFPRPIMRACLTAVSAIFPRTKATTLGASG